MVLVNSEPGVGGVGEIVIMIIFNIHNLYLLIKNTMRF